MGKLIFHNDFNFIEVISVEDQFRVKKTMKIKSSFAWIIFSVCDVIITGALFWSGKLKFYIFAMFLIFSIIILTVNIKFLISDSKIIGIAYGSVKCKETKNKVMTNHDDRKICPWYEENDYINYQKPIISSIKLFYYVDIIFFNVEGEMKHICCYENDFKNVKEGDKMIVVRFKNNEIIAVPAAKPDNRSSEI